MSGVPPAVVAYGGAGSCLNKQRETEPRSATAITCVWVRILPKLPSRAPDCTWGGGNDFKYVRCAVHTRCRSPVPRRCGTTERSAEASAFLQLNLAVPRPVPAPAARWAMSLSVAGNGERRAALTPGGPTSLSCDISFPGTRPGYSQQTVKWERCQTYKDKRGFFSWEQEEVN